MELKMVSLRHVINPCSFENFNVFKAITVLLGDITFEVKSG